MSAAALFASIAVAHALGVASPGPDFAVVVRQTLAHGRRAGIATAIGIACGISVHVGYGLFGLAWAIEQWPALLDGLRLLGAALLVWLGWGALRSQPQQPAATDAPTPTDRRSFAIGLATNLLNVKAMLFFIALFSTVIGPAIPLSLKLGLGIWLIVATGAWFSLIAWTLGHPRLRMLLQMHAHHLDRAMGALLMLLGMAMLMGPRWP